MTDSKSNMAQCSKCGTEISENAERCPQCGYEPGSSILSKLIYWIFALPWALVFGFLAVVSVVGVVMGEMAFGEFIGVLVAVGLLGGLPFWYVRRYRRRKRMGPTE